ncbi:ester cyclase [Cellulomonas aerilata]|nr:ester cyclase [Cellulomonas aerilata]
MAYDTDALLDLWTAPPDDDAAASAAFRALYTDPVVVNGVPLTASDLVTRARALRAALADPEREVLELVEDGDKVVVAFRLTGRHVGPLGSALGAVPATGRTVSMRVVDVLTLEGGRIARIQMVADELGLLLQAGAVALVDPGPPSPAAG